MNRGPQSAGLVKALAVAALSLAAVAFYRKKRATREADREYRRLAARVRQHERRRFARALREKRDAL